MSRYDLEQFDPSPDPDLLCCICTGVLFDPVETSCRHVFCRSCINTWIARKKTCPACRNLISGEGDIKPVLPLVQGLINRLVMKCKYEVNGCSEKIALEGYDMHCNSCQYKKVQCDYSRCKQEVLKRDLQEHQSSCTFCEIKCDKRCGLLVLVSDLDTHDCVTALTNKLHEQEDCIAQARAEHLRLEQSAALLNQQLVNLEEQLQTLRGQRYNRDNSDSDSIDPLLTTDEDSLDNSVNTLDVNSLWGSSSSSTVVTISGNSTTTSSSSSSDSDDNDDENGNSMVERNENQETEVEFRIAESNRVSQSDAMNESPDYNRELSIDITSDVENVTSNTHNNSPECNGNMNRSENIFGSSLIDEENSHDSGVPGSLETTVGLIESSGSEYQGDCNQEQISNSSSNDSDSINDTNGNIDGSIEAEANMSENEMSLTLNESDDHSIALGDLNDDYNSVEHYLSDEHNVETNDLSILTSDLTDNTQVELTDSWKDLSETGDQLSDGSFSDVSQSRNNKVYNNTIEKMCNSDNGINSSNDANNSNDNSYQENDSQDSISSFDMYEEYLNNENRTAFTNCESKDSFEHQSSRTRSNNIDLISSDDDTSQATLNISGYGILKKRRTCSESSDTHSSSHNDIGNSLSCLDTNDSNYCNDLEDEIHKDTNDVSISLHENQCNNGLSDDDKSSSVDIFDDLISAVNSVSAPRAELCEIVDRQKDTIKNNNSEVNERNQSECEPIDLSTSMDNGKSSCTFDESNNINLMTPVNRSENTGHFNRNIDNELSSVSYLVNECVMEQSEDSVHLLSFNKNNVTKSTRRNQNDSFNNHCKVVSESNISSSLSGFKLNALESNCAHGEESLSFSTNVSKASNNSSSNICTSQSAMVIQSEHRKRIIKRNKGKNERKHSLDSDDEEKQSKRMKFSHKSVAKSSVKTLNIDNVGNSTQRFDNHSATCKIKSYDKDKGARKRSHDTDVNENIQYKRYRNETESLPSTSRANIRPKNVQVSINVNLNLGPSINPVQPLPIGIPVMSSTPVATAPLTHLNRSTTSGTIMTDSIKVNKLCTSNTLTEAHSAYRSNFSEKNCNAMLTSKEESSTSSSNARNNCVSTTTSTRGCSNVSSTLRGDNSSSEEEEDPSWEPTEDSPSDCSISEDESSSGGDSYTVYVPKSAAQMLEEWDSAVSDDSWTP